MNPTVIATTLTLVLVACAANDSTPATVLQENAIAQKDYSYDEHIIRQAHNRLEVLGKQ